MSQKFKGSAKGLRVAALKSFKVAGLLLLSLYPFNPSTLKPVFGQELKKIRIGYPSLSFRQSNVWVARETGLFKKYGLDVDPIFLRGGQVATLALASGDPPIVNIGTVVQANLQGHSLVLVAAVETKYNQIVFARPGITKLEQLKGRRLGITGFGSATHFASSSLTELLQIGDLGVEVQGNGLATSRSFIQSNREIVKAAVKGYVEAIHFIYGNKKEAQKVFAKFMRNNDPEFLENAYQHYIKTIPKKPYPTLKGIQFLLDMLAPQMPQAKSAKPEQFVDLSFLQELEKEGFFSEMAKRYPSK